MSFVVCSWLPISYADVFSGRVVGVTDGDTLTVLEGQTPRKVRVAGIDAPEKRQPFGARSKAGLSDCAFGQSAVVEWKKIDRYGRIIGKVFIGDADCGLRQIQAGLAWHYVAYAKDQSREDQLSYAAAESAARDRAKGQWADLNAIPPWDWRRIKTPQTTTETSWLR